jgi:hypothetical protein
MCPADKELMIKSRANEVCHSEPCRFGRGTSLSKSHHLLRGLRQESK